MRNTYLTEWSALNMDPSNETLSDDDKIELIRFIPLHMQNNPGYVYTFPREWLTIVKELEVKKSLNLITFTGDIPDSNYKRELEVQESLKIGPFKEVLTATEVTRQMQAITLLNTARSFYDLSNTDTILRIVEKAYNCSLVPPSVHIPGVGEKEL